MSRKVPLKVFLKLCWAFELDFKHLLIKTPAFFFQCGRIKDFRFDFIEEKVEFAFWPEWPLYDGMLLFKYSYKKVYKIITLMEVFKLGTQA